jgi:hypothetical protein
MCGCSLALLLLVTVEPAQIGWGGTDFVQYHAAHQLVKSGQNPYDRAAAEAKQIELGRGGGVAMFAPPWSLLPSWPLASLSIEQATLANVVINITLLILISIVWQSLLFPRRYDLLPLMLASLPLWYPVLALLGMGQLSLWPLLGFTGWLWCWQRGWRTLGAVLLVLLVIKPHLGLLPGCFVLGVWMRERDWKSLLVFVGALLVVTFLTLLMRNSIWLDYYHSLQSGAAPSDYQTATLDCFLRQCVGASAKYITWPLWLISLMVVVRLGYQPDALARTDLAMMSVLILTLSLATVPYAFSFDMVAVIPAWIVAVGMYLTRNEYQVPSMPSSETITSTLNSARSSLAHASGWYLLAALALADGLIIAGKLWHGTEVVYWPVAWIVLLAICLSRRS